MSAVRIGVDIGGTKVDAVVLDPGGDIVARHRVPVRMGDDGVVGSARDAVSHVCDIAGVTASDAGAIGVGVPGAVTGGVVRHALNLGVTELDLSSQLSAAWGVPVHVENDVNAAAIGAWHLLGDGRTSVAYLNVGTGLAAGIILDGRLWRGARGAAGEIGHIGIDPAGPVGADGLRGGLETYASGSGVALQWGREGQAAVEVLRAAQDGDVRAREIRERLLGGVAHAARILILTLDVAHVMLGGGLTGMGAELLDGAREVIREWEEASAFLASLEIGSRLSLVPGDQPVAAIGAAMLEVDHG
ncbi:ROK family protein [Demequina activiva]|uniref:NagC family transcriptional regulator n=1 Tax=Demequina activiva TaxID=1582364 RepID=A0A919Q1T5_9MICO|nr:ROK family protein [Demequina activiva]GIG54720.1 NagC family transcriptional regulator [Demequina activiva]